MAMLKMHQSSSTNNNLNNIRDCFRIVNHPKSQMLCKFFFSIWFPIGLLAYSVYPVVFDQRLATVDM